MAFSERVFSTAHIREKEGLHRLPPTIHSHRMVGTEPMTKTEADAAMATFVYVFK
jgi:hypothetical protein